MAGGSVFLVNPIPDLWFIISLFNLWYQFSKFLGSIHLNIQPIQSIKEYYLPHPKHN